MQKIIIKIFKNKLILGLVLIFAFSSFNLFAQKLNFDEAMKKAKKDNKKVKKTLKKKINTENNVSSKSYAILDKKDEEKWIKKTITKEETMDLLKPYDESKMTAYTISKMITTKDTEVNVPEVLAPFQYNNLEPLPSQKSLF